MPRKKRGWIKSVIGVQWGDEGKGKIVDYMSQEADVVERYAGGGNAGHRVVNESGEFKARIVPVGMFTESVQLCVIGRGTVPALVNIEEELRICQEKGIDVTRLRLDSSAHLIMPYHLAEDRLSEEAKDGNKIGTTGNGIGPCYASKIKREGLRAGDLLNFNAFKQRFTDLYREKFWILYSRYHKHWEKCPKGCDACIPIRKPANESLAEIEEQVKYLTQTFGKLENLICDTLPLLWKAMDDGKRILLEGAQGALLSIDGGSYPYVTSSNTGVASALQGSGIPYNKITEVIGVVKAYTSRVGNGPLPTRMCHEIEDKVREKGHEYGTVTGRPRNCGWIDPLAIRRVVQENGVTYLAVTLLDVLDDVNIIGLGRGYNCAKDKHEVICQDVDHMLRSENPQAVVEYISGWAAEGKVEGCRSYGDLPMRAKNYLTMIEEACGCPIKIISTGANREETITC